MKKCPYCGTQIADQSHFCTECGKEMPINKVCPYCGSLVKEGKAFCTKCGKRIDGAPSVVASEKEQLTCPHCGSPVKRGAAFCTECGKSIKEKPEVGNDNQIQSENDDIEYYFDISEESKTWWDYRLYIFGGLFLVLLLSAGWWYYDYSSQRALREKAIADSLEIARHDSIMQGIREKENAYKDSIEKTRLQSIQKPYLDLLDKYSAKKEHWGEYYFLYDINGDGLPEIWLQILEKEDYKLLVYSNKNEKANLLLKKDAGHPYHHSFHKGDNYILLVFAHMGSQVILKYTFENGIIKEENYFTLEADSMNEAVYKEVSEPEVTTYEITDKSPIFEIK